MSSNDEQRIKNIENEFKKVIQRNAKDYGGKINQMSLLIMSMSEVCFNSAMEETQLKNMNPKDKFLLLESARMLTHSEVIGLERNGLISNLKI